jgi:hypothetical protein
MTVILDILQCMTLVAMPVAIVVVTTSPWVPGALTFVLGLWTFLVSVLAVPAVVVLHNSPPRIPISQRSALIASASWFWRSVWAGAVFALSIVLGAVAGVVSSRISEHEHDLGSALGESITGVAQFALWPIVLTVAAVAYVVMGARWLFDLGRIVDDGGARTVAAAFERRWFGEGVHSPDLSKVRDGVTTLVVSVVGRVALLLTMVTVGAAVAFAAIAIFRQ